MNRIISAAALTAALTTGALAATDYETTTINQYLPDVDVSTLSDEQVGALEGIATSADEADKEQEMRAYIGAESSTMTTTGETPTHMSDMSNYDSVITEYLPDVDPATLSDEQKAALVGMASSGDDADKEQRMRAYLKN